MPQAISRRRFLGMLGLGTLGFAFPGSLLNPFNKTKPILRFYVGTYTDGTGSKGIYQCSFDTRDGSMAILDSTDGIANPSFLTLDASRQYLYAVGETGSYQGQEGGSVHAFRIDPDSGALHFINARPTRGAAPCHLSLDNSQKMLMVANYTGGNIAAFPLRSDGGIGERSDLKQHHGTGPNTDRQEGPHAHCILPVPGGRHALSADLGADKIYLYQPRPTTGKLQDSDPAFIKVKAGSGPRHIAFHPDGNTVYVINELASTVTVFTYDVENGSLEAVQTLSTLPAGFTEHNQCAEIQVSSDGRFVYGSNRGHDSIVVYRVDAKSGRLQTVQHQSTLGHWPRYFLIDPTGKHLLAANKDSNSIVAFHRDENSGELRPAGHKLELPSPVCMQFI